MHRQNQTYESARFLKVDAPGKFQWARPPEEVNRQVIRNGGDVDAWAIGVSSADPVEARW